MSLRRLASTAAALAVVGALLSLLSPGSAVLLEAVTAPQRVVDTGGADSVVVAWAALLAWLTWCWGGLGLVLTAASALPGALGAAARLVLRVLLPAGARRGAALLLGIGLGAGIGAPVLAHAAPAVAPDPVSLAAPDWPAARSDRTPGAGAPDWGTASGDPAGDHVVVRGDCLWDIAAARLAGSGDRPADGEIADAVQAWWTANAAVIGPDPDLLLPGQVLVPPEDR